MSVVDEIMDCITDDMTIEKAREAYAAKLEEIEQRWEEEEVRE
jgi:hypothetical protein